MNMALNRIQFQKGLSLPEFMKRYGSDEQCEAALVAARWPAGYECPRCGGRRYSPTFNGRRLWECMDRACRYQCSSISGTVFQDTKLPLSLWFMALYLMTQAKNTVSALEMKRALGVSYPTALLMKHKLMQVMLEREAERKLSGRVEADEGYLGGQATGGKRGRGAGKKAVFVTAVATNQRGRPTGVRFDRLADVSAASFTHWAQLALAPGAAVVSDAWPSLARALSDTGHAHERHVTGGGRAAAQHPAMRWVNTLQGNLKTAIGGTLHAFDFARHADRYLAEFAWRFNRRTDLASLVPRLLFRSINTPPRTALWLKRPESC
jgi:transposase-like protein